MSLYVFSKLRFYANFIFIFICKSVQILFLFADQSIFTLFGSLVNFYFLQISPSVLFFAEWSLGQNSVQEATQAIKARCHSLIGPKAHMAAYKRPPTAQVRKKSHRTRATSQTPQNFLSPFS